MAVGSALRTAREQQGLSLEDVAARVKLRPSIIAALEIDDFTLCGGDVYARGHIRVVAQTLGLDPDEVIELWEASVG
jgi:cytoskeleton protein RodZ